MGKLIKGPWKSRDVDYDDDSYEEFDLDSLLWSPWTFRIIAVTIVFILSLLIL